VILVWTITSIISYQILKELHKSCQKEDGTDDQKKGSQLLEVYAIEIQIYTETKDNKKLKVNVICYMVSYNFEILQFYCCILSSGFVTETQQHS